MRFLLKKLTLLNPKYLDDVEWKTLINLLDKKNYKTKRDYCLQDIITVRLLYLYFQSRIQEHKWSKK